MNILSKALLFLSLNFMSSSMVLANDIEPLDHKSADLISSEIKVYKSATCGCCGKWISHLDKAGFITSFENSGQMSVIKDALNLPKNIRSCHTGVVTNTKGKFVFEGHVPADVMQRFLANPPENSLGLAVPGMPIGSPGMEVGDRLDYYEVLLIKQDGSVETYAKINEDQLK